MEAPAVRRPFRWGFGTAVLAILALICVGQAGGVAMSDFGPEHATGPLEFVGGMRAKDWLFVGFLVSAAAFVWLQRAAVARFFRSMNVGVSLIALTALAVITGVLVPQIENFEDPTERVPTLAGIPEETVAKYLASPKTAADEDPRLRPDDNPALAKLPPDQALRLKGWRREYEAFRWAEGYFLYHLTHPYGLGMPPAVLPPQVVEGLDRFGERYGEEERANRRIEMDAAFSGRLKTAEIGKLIRRHETGIRRAFQVCTALHLNRTYKSSWFTSLLALLATGILFNTFRGDADRLLSLRKVGFFTVHMGVLTILLGGFVSRHRTDRGILHLDVTEGPSDTYWAYGSSDKKTRMPFAVKADRFARKDWPTLEVGFAGDAFKSRLPEYTLWPGFEKDLDFAQGEDGVLRPRIHLEVLKIAGRAEIRMPRFYESEKPGDPRGQGPLADLSVRLAGVPGDGAAAEARTALLAPAYPDRDTLLDPAWKFRLRAVYGASQEDMRRELVSADPSVLGTLEVRAPGAGDVVGKHVPFRLGESLDVAGGYTIVVREVNANFRLDPSGKTEIRDPGPLADQYPHRPAAWVEITPKDGGEKERRLLIESIDWEAQGRQKKFTYKDLVLSLHWESWSSAGPPRFLLAWSADGSAALVSEDGSRKPVEPGRDLELPGESRITAAHLYRNVQYESQIEFLAPPVAGPRFDASFYSHDPVGLEMAVTSYPGTPKERRDVVRMATSDASLANVWTDPEQRYWLRFYGNDKNLPFEWRSVLSIWKKDAEGRLYKVDLGPEENREVRVNDYLYYEGYRFFQTNAIPELPTYSGIGVVYDPGIPVVLLGMYLTIVGTALAFVIRPIVEGRRARRSEAAAAAGAAS
jgi:hypothetical protein